MIIASSFVTWTCNLHLMGKKHLAPVGIHRIIRPYVLTISYHSATVHISYLISFSIGVHNITKKTTCHSANQKFPTWGQINPPKKDPTVAKRKKTTRPVNLGSLVFQDIARDHSSEVLEIPDRHTSINHRYVIDLQSHLLRSGIWTQKQIIIYLKYQTSGGLWMLMVVDWILYKLVQFFGRNAKSQISQPFRTFTFLRESYQFGSGFLNAIGIILQVGFPKGQAETPKLNHQPGGFLFAARKTSESFVSCASFNNINQNKEIFYETSDVQAGILRTSM